MELTKTTTTKEALLYPFNATAGMDEGEAETINFPLLPGCLSARRDKASRLESDVERLQQRRELQTSNQSIQDTLEILRVVHPEVQESMNALDKDAVGIISPKNRVKTDIDSFSDSAYGSISRCPSDVTFLTGLFERPVLNTQSGGPSFSSPQVQQNGPVLTQDPTLSTIGRFGRDLSTEVNKVFLTDDIIHDRLDIIGRTGNRRASIAAWEGSQLKLLNIASPTKMSLFQDSAASGLENEEISLWSDFSDSDLGITDGDSAILGPLKAAFIREILAFFAASKLACTLQAGVCDENSASSQPKQNQARSSKNINSQHSESTPNGTVSSKRVKGNDEDSGDGDRLLACPFCKNDPLRHLSCYSYIIRDISRLK
jgi:hypothetical protein